MNTGVMFSSKSMEWATPKELYEILDGEFHFTLDPCSTDENAKCKLHYTLKDNGLEQNWGGAKRVLQSTIWKTDWCVGREMLQGKSKTKDFGCHAHTCKD